MAAYCVFDVVEVTDGDKMSRYRQEVAATVEKYGGRYVVRGGSFDVVEGDWQPVYPVILEFPSLERAHRWYDSEEYGSLKAMRQEASKANGVFIAGV